MAHIKKSKKRNNPSAGNSPALPEWIFVVGMVRSGSTWIYNVVREILSETGCGSAIGYVGEGSSLDQALQSPAESTPRLIKFHDPTDIACDMLASGRARAIYSRRDLRDVAVSLIRFENTSLVDLICSQRLGRIIATHERWTACDNLLCIEYTDAMARQRETIAQMAGFLGLPLSTEAAQRIAERCSLDQTRQRMQAISSHHEGDDGLQTRDVGRGRQYDRQTLLHANHVTSGGITGAYRDVLDKGEIALFDGIYGDWLQSNHYDTASILEFETTDDTLIAPIADGLKVCTPPSLRLMTPYALIEQGDWFEDEIKFVRRWLRPGMQVVDIGANYGCYTLSMAKRISGGGKVWAVEPAASTADYLARSIRLNDLDNVELVRAALSDHAGEANLCIEDNAELNALSHTQDDAKKTETVRLLTLNHMMDRFGEQGIDFVKLDAEGEEIRILDGGEAFFSRHSPLVMFELKHGDIVNEGLIARFDAYGYSTYMLIPGLDVLAPFDPESGVDPYRLNLFCCKDDRAASLAKEGLLILQEQPITDALPEGDAWKQYLQDKAYAKDLLPIWKQMPDEQRNIPGEQQYLRILNAFARAHEAGDAALRYRHLSAAFIELINLMEAYSSPPRLLTLARIAADLGQRAAAVNLLNQVVEHIDQQRTFLPEEPFLATSEHASGIPTGGHLANWVLAQSLSERERLHAFSSYFTGVKVMPFLQIIRQLQYPDPEMYRRLHLVQSLATADQ